MRARATSLLACNSITSPEAVAKGDTAMVKLTVTDATRAAVIQLTDTSAPGSSANLLPVELLDDIQRHVDTTELRWIDHKLLARISRWNSARPSQSPNLLPSTNIKARSD